MERISYIDDKKIRQIKTESFIATLMEDQKKLREHYNTIQLGPHAKKCKEVRPQTFRKMLRKPVLFLKVFLI